MTIEEIEKFVAPLYAPKDTMHDLSHIRRVLRKAQELAASYASEVDDELRISGAYLHGIIRGHGAQVREFLRTTGFGLERVQQIMRVASDSQKDEVPKTLEGTILHDAHLIDGVRTFLVVKSLVTGSARGQTLAQTIDFIERSILGKFHCYLPDAQMAYAEKEAYARQFLEELKRDL